MNDDLQLNNNEKTDIPDTADSALPDLPETPNNNFNLNLKKSKSEPDSDLLDLKETKQPPVQQNVSFNNPGNTSGFTGNPQNPFKSQRPPCYPPQNNMRYAPAAAQPYYPPYYYRPDPKELERMDVAQCASSTGKITIILLVVMTAIAILIEVVAAFCGLVEKVPDVNDPYVGFSPMGFYLYEGLASLAGIFIPSFIILKSSKRTLSDTLPFKPIKGKDLLAVVMAGISLCMVAQIVAVLIQINFNLFGIDIYKGLDTKSGTGIFDLIMSTICTAVIPALVEEFAYRGLVLSILRKHGDMFAVVGSAFLFGMLHGNFAQIPFAFVVGLILAYVRIKTESMLPGILIHFGNNFYAVTATILSESLPEEYGNAIEGMLIILLVVIGFASIYYLTKNKKELFDISPEKTLLTFGEKIKVFFSAGTVIACIVILSLMSIAVYAVSK